jgi:hypothetical protein
MILKCPQNNQNWVKRHVLDLSALFKQTFPTLQCWMWPPTAACWRLRHSWVSCSSIHGDGFSGLYFFLHHHYGRHILTVFHHSLIHIKMELLEKIWQPPQYLAENVELSLDGDVHKEGRWWHQVPRVIQQVNVPVACKQASRTCCQFTALRPRNEVPWISYSTAPSICPASPPHSILPYIPLQSPICSSYFLG